MTQKVALAMIGKLCNSAMLLLAAAIMIALALRLWGRIGRYF